MKTQLLSFCLLLSLVSSAQRYLQPTFESVDITSNITYGNAPDYLGNNQDLILDFYEPSGDLETERPLIVYLHGGGFASGSRTLESIEMICEDLARIGYAVANIDYRLDPNFQLYDSEADRRAMTDAMHDARAAVRYFRANAAQYKIDPDQIALGGESAGAITSMMVNYVDTQDELEATYPLANPNNIEGGSGNAGLDSRANFTLCLCGMMLDPTSMQTADAPFLWVHGTADSFIPLALAELVTDAAENIGLPHTKILQQNADHCPWYYLSNPNWENYLDSTVTQIAEFLYPQLELGLQESAATQVWSIFPNPTNGQIQLLGIPEQEEIEIVDASGKVALRARWKNSGLDLSDLTAGIYLVKAASRNPLRLVVN